MTRSTAAGQPEKIIRAGRLAVTLGLGRSALPVAGGWTGQAEVAAGLAVLQGHWAARDLAAALAATERLWRLDAEDRLVVFWRVVTLAAAAQAGQASLAKQSFIPILQRARLLSRKRSMELADLAVVALELGLKQWGGRLLRDAVDACGTPGEIGHMLRIAELGGSAAAHRFVYGRLIERFPAEQSFRLAAARQFVSDGQFRRALLLLGNRTGKEPPSPDLMRLRAKAEVAEGRLAKARRSAIALEKLDPADETAEAVHLAIRLRLFGRLCRSAIRRKIRGWLKFRVDSLHNRS